MTRTSEALKLNGSVGNWLKLLIPLGALAAGYGVLKSDVEHNERDIQAVEQRIDSRLERIEDKVDRLLENR